MFNIIKSPIITEKNTLKAGLLNEYAFKVEVTANKKQIKEAIEKAFNVKVLRVNTMVCRKEPKKLGKFPGAKKYWKKAMVKLREGDKFDFVAS